MKIEGSRSSLLILFLILNNEAAASKILWGGRKELNDREELNTSIISGDERQPPQTGFMRAAFGRVFSRKKSEKIPDELRPAEILIPSTKSSSSDSTDKDSPMSQDSIKSDSLADPISSSSPMNKENSAAATLLDFFYSPSDVDPMSLSTQSTEEAQPSNSSEVLTVTLPPLRFPEYYGPQQDFDRKFAEKLYSWPDGNFVDVFDLQSVFVAKMIPLTWHDPERTLFDHRIEIDLMSPAMGLFFERYQNHSLLKGQEDLAAFRESVTSMILNSIGRASTLDPEQVYKLGEASQRVLLTERDIFYYPGMLKLASLFHVLFDPNRSASFFNQFINTFYSGVYGPTRKNLFFITRIQDIPERQISNGLLESSLRTDSKEHAAMISEEIRNTKASYLNPHNRKLFLSIYSKEELGYVDLDPVPKTIEDVLDATVKILMKHSRKILKIREDYESIVSQVYDKDNLKHLQSFYMDLFCFQEIKTLLHSMAMKTENGYYKEAYKNHAAAFHYAAFIRTRVSGRINFANMLRFLSEMYTLRINVKELESVREASRRAADSEIK